LRAKDRLSLGAVRHYRDLCSNQAGVPIEHLDSIDVAVNRFEQFRRDNDDAMKMPD
jgi:hypothetical protein